MCFHDQNALKPLNEQESREEFRKSLKKIENSKIEEIPTKLKPTNMEKLMNEAYAKEYVKEYIWSNTWA